MGKHAKMIEIMSDFDLMEKIVTHYQRYGSKTATAKKFNISFYAVGETVELYKRWKENEQQTKLVEY